jgi:hypothetical protein
MLWLRILGVLLLCGSGYCGWIVQNEYAFAQREEQRGAEAIAKLKKMGPGPMTVERELLEIDAKYGIPGAQQTRDEARVYVILAVVLALGGIGCLAWSFWKRTPGTSAGTT